MQVQVPVPVLVPVETCRGSRLEDHDRPRVLALAAQAGRLDRSELHMPRVANALLKAFAACLKSPSADPGMVPIMVPETYAGEMTVWKPGLWGATAARKA